VCPIQKIKYYKPLKPPCNEERNLETIDLQQQLYPLATIRSPIFMKWQRHAQKNDLRYSIFRKNMELNESTVVKLLTLKIYDALFC